MGCAALFPCLLAAGWDAKTPSLLFAGCRVGLPRGMSCSLRPADCSVGEGEGCGSWVAQEESPKQQPQQPQQQDGQEEAVDSLEDISDGEVQVGTWTWHGCCVAAFWCLCVKQGGGCLRWACAGWRAEAGG